MAYRGIIGKQNYNESNICTVLNICIRVRDIPLNEQKNLRLLHLRAHLKSQGQDEKLPQINIKVLGWVSVKLNVAQFTNENMKICVIFLSLCLRLGYSVIVPKPGENNGCNNRQFKCANDQCLSWGDDVCGGLSKCSDESDLSVCANTDGYDSLHNVTYQCYKDYTQCPVSKNSRLKTLECYNSLYSCKY